MKVQILQMLEGARQATGLTVIIDVFRAFSVECHAYARGARLILPVGSIEGAFALRNEHPGSLLVGERNGIKCEGFDCGNSPSELEKFDVQDKILIHTTSAGTQGVTSAIHADEILGGALVNARATAQYILSRNPETVSLVCMGWNGQRETEEDTLCAEYLAALLRGEDPDITAEIADLARTEGKKFFDPAKNHIFPQKDFPMCTMLNAFSFALKIERDGERLKTQKIDIQ